MGVIGGVHAWLVDGNVLRDCFKTDYVEGGHGYVYAWIPNDEIWIEESIAPDERRAILLHEYEELVKMRDEGWEYADAHEYAGQKEFEYRQKHRRTAMDRQAVARGLVKLAKELTSAQAPSEYTGDLAEVWEFAYEAAFERVSGNVQRAMQLDRKLDRLVKSLEQRGLADEAVEAEEDGRQEGQKDGLL
jgi:hypothetical protein